MIMSEAVNLGQVLSDLRQRLEAAFSSETAAPGFAGSAPSTGHCAVVAVIASKLLGASMVSTTIDGQSHWFNRIRVGGREIDFDLTGDQYGFRPVQYTEANRLYGATRVCSHRDLNAETLERAKRLAMRAGFSTIALEL